jgi:hypothetical protein
MNQKPFSLCSRCFNNGLIEVENAYSSQTESVMVYSELYTHHQAKNI